jgi:hypothetical protein
LKSPQSWAANYKPKHPSVTTGTAFGVKASQVRQKSGLVTFALNAKKKTSVSHFGM